MPTAQPSQQPPQPSQSAEAAGDLVAMSFPGARRVAGWIFWVVLPLLCLAAIAMSSKNLGGHIGKKPDGIRGNFVAASRSCTQGICSYGGRFTSDDGTIKSLALLGDPRWRTGEVHRATYDGKNAEVTALPGHWDPTASVLAALGALTYLGVLGYLLRSGGRESKSRTRLSPALS